MAYARQNNMVTLTELERFREIGNTGKMLLVLLWVTSIAFARTPSPCLVAQLSYQPAIRLLASDFCLMDGLWRQEMVANTPVPALAFLRNITDGTSARSCNDFDNGNWYDPVCRAPRDSVCFPKAATSLIRRCEQITAFVTNRTKMCDCGMLPGCSIGLACIYGPDLLHRVQLSRGVCLTNPATAYLKHAQTVLNLTWAPHVDTSLALTTLDACIATLHPHARLSNTIRDSKPNYNIAARYVEYVAIQTATARKLKTNRRVACLLVKEATNPTTPLVADMVRRWQLKYCEVHVCVLYCLKKFKIKN